MKGCETMSFKYGVSYTKQVRDQLISDPDIELESPNANQGLPVYGVIYKITNLVNGRVYVGKTTKFGERLRAYAHSIVYGYSSKYWVRSKELANDLHILGAEKFDMHIIAYAYSKNELHDMECRLISKYENIYPGIYNANFPGTAYINAVENNPSTLLHNRIKRSIPLLAIDYEHHMIYVCDGLAAFGYHINRSKDIIKTYVRKLIPIYDKRPGKEDYKYYLAYLSDDPLSEIENKLFQREIDYYFRFCRYASDDAKLPFVGDKNFMKSCEEHNLPVHITCLCARSLLDNKNERPLKNFKYFRIEYDDSDKKIKISNI